MKAYFIRRILLVPITLLGVTLIVFFLTYITPGGPVERMLQEASQGADESKKSSGSNQAMNDAQIEQLEREFGYDRFWLVAYAQWLGVMPKERMYADAEFNAKSSKLAAIELKDPENQAIVTLKGSVRPVIVTQKNGEITSAVYADQPERSIEEDGWSTRFESIQERQERWAKRNDKELAKAPKHYKDRVAVYKPRLAGLLQGDLGKSSTYGDSVSSMIGKRIPISLLFGFLTALITYGVSIPLGIVKAIKHRTLMDNVSSVLIFAGYSIPGFALGGVLIVYLGARWGMFPLAGIVSPDFNDMNLGSQILDIAHHACLPLLCYVVGGFAVTTMMMKNNLMDNLSADYVRTAVAKGVDFKTAVFKHAFRNSFIPIAAGLGHLISIFIGGSLLIETIFDIPGYGLLQFQALQDQDTYVIMGTLTLGALLMMVGNILSDVIVAMVDPRIKFQ